MPILHSPAVDPGVVDAFGVVIGVEVVEVEVAVEVEEGVGV
jgi:hypothetical protein